VFDESTIRRFENEAKAVASLHHSNIVPLFEAGESDGVRYYAMQLIEGRPLDQVIRELRDGDGEHRLDSRVGASAVRTAPESPASPGSTATGHRPAPRRAHAAIARIGLQVADALATAHRQGVLHRDIKPSNLILDDSGRVWVTDFGLARLAESDLTQSSDFLGTLRYMSPERFDGEGDERVDVYALGATLYELTTLQPAFPGGDQVVLLDRIRKEDPPALDRLVPDLPRDLQTIIEKCLAKEPARRYRTAWDLADDLQRFLESRPIRARRATPIERLVFWSRRNPAAALLLSVLLSVAVAAVVAAIEFRHQSQDNRRLARNESEARSEAQDAFEEATAARDELRRSLYFSTMSSAMTALDARSGVRRTRQILDRWIPSNGEPDLRGFEWYLLSSMARESEIVRDIGERILDFGWGPDATVGLTPDSVRVWNGESGGERFSIPAASFSRMGVSGDGRFLAIGQDGAIAVADLFSGEIVARLPVDFPYYGCIRLTSDGSRVIAISAERTQRVPMLCIWAVATGELLRSTEVAGGQHFVVSPDERAIAVTTTDGQIVLHDLESFDVLRQWQVGGYPTPPRFTPDGRTMAVLCRKGMLWLLDVETGDVKLETRAQRDWGRFVTISSDGRFVVTGGRDYSLFVVDRQTQQLSQLYGPRDRLGGAAFAPDGSDHPYRLLAGSFDGTVHAWTLGGPSAVLRRKLDRVGEWFGVAFGPDTKRLAVIPVSHTPEMLSVETAEQLPDSQAIGWTRDGRRLEADPRGIRVIDETAGEGRLIELPNCQELVFGGIVATGDEVLAVANAGAIHVASSSSPSASRRIGEGLTVPHRPLLALSPDGSRLVAGERNDLHVFDVVTGEPVVSWNRLPYQVKQSAFHPNGHELAVSCSDQEIRVWDLRRPGEPRVFSGHAHQVEGLAIHPDGTRLASASRDGTVKLWDWATGSEILSLRHDDTMVDRVAWSPDGQRLASVDQAGVVRLFSAAEAYAAER
ncbi:MAG: serine/threonine-protein kinase, partial [Planctomycetota bacterium]